MTPATILRDVTGLQAQVLDAAALGLRARSRGLRRADVTTALNDERSIVRTWLMRGTLHLVASDDLAWMLRILGPVFAAGNTARHAQLGLDATTKSNGVTAIRQILAREAPLTRYEIVDRLRRVGIELDAKTQAPIHLIAFAALQGILCLGPDRANGEPTYVLIDDWLGKRPPVTDAAALGELARRYFAAYGPASLDDFVAWSGLPATQARSALSAARTSLEEISIAGRPHFHPRGRLRRWPQPGSGSPSVRMLPAFDTYLLGYRSRDLAVPSALQKRLQRGGGWIHPAVVVDGRAIGSWQLRRKGRSGAVNVEAVAQLPKAISAQIEDEVADIGRFLDLSLRPSVGQLR